MMKNFCYQSGQTRIIHEDNEIKIIFNGVSALIMTPDEFVNFFEICGRVANHIVTHPPIEMGWKPEEHNILGLCFDCGQRPATFEGRCNDCNEMETAVEEAEQLHYERWLNGEE